MRLLVSTKGFALLLRLALCGVFLMAALPKLQEPGGFAEDVAAYQVTNRVLSGWVAIVLPWVELVCAVGLLTPWMRRASGILLSILLTAFICLHAHALLQGLDIGCGCFGKEAEDNTTNYLWLFTRNLVLLAGCITLLTYDLRNDPDKRHD